MMKKWYWLIAAALWGVILVEVLFYGNSSRFTQAIASLLVITMCIEYSQGG